MDELTRLVNKRFELAQRMCQLQSQLGNVMKEFDEISRQIYELSKENSKRE